MTRCNLVSKYSLFDAKVLELKCGVTGRFPPLKYLRFLFLRNQAQLSSVVSVELITDELNLCNKIVSIIQHTECANSIWLTQIRVRGNGNPDLYKRSNYLYQSIVTSDNLVIKLLQTNQLTK